jgi:hypothetical protein
LVAAATAAVLAVPRGRIQDHMARTRSAGA